MACHVHVHDVLNFAVDPGLYSPSTMHYDDQLALFVLCSSVTNTTLCYGCMVDLVVLINSEGDTSLHKYMTYASNKQ